MAQAAKPVQLDTAQVRLLRMRAQRLQPQFPHGTSVVEVVKDIVCVQAQDTKVVPLAIRVRAPDLSQADIAQAWADDRSIVRTWLMRGTLHLVTSEDLAWLLSLLGPTFADSGKGRRLQLGLDADVAKRGVSVITNALSGKGPLTKTEIADHLAAHHLPSAGQAPIHLIAYAAQQGLVCAGPDRDGKATYVLLEEWVKLGKLLSRPEAFAELVRRYLAAYAPATPEDCAAWSGLRVTDIREAWKQLGDEIIPVEIEGKTGGLLHLQAMWFDQLDSLPDSAPIVRLLPSFDPYLLGYKTRDFMVEKHHTAHILPGGGMLSAVLLVNGEAVGTWKSAKARTGLEIAIKPFAKLNSDVRAGIDVEVEDICRFYGTPASWRVVD